jgi:hypothetical protein
MQGLLKKSNYFNTLLLICRILSTSARYWSILFKANSGKRARGRALFASKFYSILFEAIEEYVAGELEESRRFGFIGAAFFERLKDDLLFYLIETNASIRQDYAEFF